MEQIKKYKNVIIVIILIIVSAYAYRTFFGVDGIDSALLSSIKSSDVSESTGQDLLKLLSTLHNIQLNDTIFSDPVFRGLEDLSQELVPEPVGRNNPFAPIGSSGGANVLSTGL